MAVTNAPSLRWMSAGRFDRRRAPFETILQTDFESRLESALGGGGHEATGADRENRRDQMRMQCVDIADLTRKNDLAHCIEHCADDAHSPTNRQRDTAVHAHTVE